MGLFAEVDGQRQRVGVSDPDRRAIAPRRNPRSLE
jgi:hypothetical protein